MAHDATVVLHELGHAIQDDQVPGLGTSHEASSMGEGFGDILGAVYFAPLVPFHAAVVGDRARPPEGVRRVDTDLRYPEDLAGEPHADGQIWSGALWDLYRQLGGEGETDEAWLRARDTLLRLVIQSHFFLNPDARFGDAATALLLADRTLYDGRHAARIRAALGAHGIAPEQDGAARARRAAPGVRIGWPLRAGAPVAGWPLTMVYPGPVAWPPVAAPVRSWPPAWPYGGWTG